MKAVWTMRDRITDFVVMLYGVVILSRDRITTVVILSRDRITTVVIRSRDRITMVVIPSWTMRDKITNF